MKVVSLKEAKKDKERRDYAALVLQRFDDFEHTDKRSHAQHAAEVNAAAKERL